MLGAPEVYLLLHTENNLSPSAMLCYRICLFAYLGRGTIELDVTYSTKALSTTRGVTLDTRNLWDNSVLKSHSMNRHSLKTNVQTE